MELLLSIAQWIWNLVQPSRNGISVSPSPFDIHWSPIGLESQILWALFLLLPDPQAGEPDMGLWTHSWERTTVIWLFPSVWVTHLEDLRSDYVTKAPLLSSHCSLFTFECRVSSGRSQSFPLIFAQRLDDCAVFMRGNELVCLFVLLHAVLWNQRTAFNQNACCLFPQYVLIIIPMILCVQI